ncbi:2-amino-4-hydroxy-6-hydroxymethyldihydropteridine diphosphokinase [Chromatium okenii]|uniref:2-amino-4-hydroxy-6- hydroxymethyldihydropteridine diphosphokinase n=1 Tax=Chromatium okenii TaxID=61644 RepID=UPI001908E0A0|nr:2-amino-4-hydroxy-6-hydroxymethyldihydropteridine diphosphokinase [Chromatium okenii]MBK1642634.1 2-amino-4-hydroxy-6-hydroxymethyldihydropteridine diphosphokinase [Chromatium okenii]
MTTHPPVRAYLALGSNLDPQRHIPLCLQRLRDLPLTSDWQESAWYLTRPWGGIAQPDFINLVVGVTTQHSALDLLAALQQIEHDLNRVRELKNGPRTIDIDVLLFGELVLDTLQLQVPHPGLLARDFMLLPLLEIAPAVRHPLDQRPLSQLVEGIAHHQILSRLTAPAALPTVLIPK